MEGRKQKAREGKWNGGFAPYGYELVNGELQIAEDEAEIIRLIYDKFIHTNMGISAIAAWLNQHGYKKKKRQNNTLDAFAASFIKGVLDNPVYCGKLAYGRRKNEKVSGTRNEYRIVKQENYMLHDGIHEGIVSETDWELAHQKREKTGVKYEKTHSLDHEHILSGILRCPLCGSGMYGNVNRKKKKDGTLYKDYFYYACKHRRLVDGHKCGYRKQWSEEKINNAVEEVIRKLVKNPKFEEAILNKIGSRIDTEEIEKEIERLVDGHKCGYRKQWSEEKINNAVEEVIRKLVKNPKFEEAILNKIGSRIDTEEIEKEIERLEKQHRQLTGAKARLGQQMDSLDIMDKFYEKKYQDMETRLYRLYDEIEGVENSIEEVKNRLLNIRQQKISEENVYQFLLYFDKLYDKFTDLEKKEFLNSFVEQVDIYEQEQPDGRFLKHIKFRFPVYFGDRETQELCWDNESTVETVVLLSK
jgi:site-specific DNA recombinase